MGVYGPPPGFYRNKPGVRINRLYCTGCMGCVRACPLKTVLEARRADDGSAYATVAAVEKCVGCGRCVRVCPTHALGLYLQ